MNEPVARNEHITTSHTLPLEWIIGGIGLLLVLSVIGYLVWHGLRGEHRPPKVVLKIDDIEPAGSSFLVRVRAINEGGETVKSLMVEGCIKSSAAEPESSTMTFENVPADSERIGGLFFTNDPRGREIKLRAHGYEK